MNILAAVASFLLIPSAVVQPPARAAGETLDGNRRSAPLRVTGDGPALRALVDALEAARGADRSTGRLTFRCETRGRFGIGTDDERVQLQAAAGTVVWSKKGTRWDYRHGWGGTEFDSAGPVRLRGLDESENDMKVLLRDGVKHEWVRRSETLFVRPASAEPVPSTLRVLPSDGWFRVDGQTTDRPWAGMIDPGRSLSNVVRIHGEADGTRVTATLHYDDGMRWAITGDLTNGGVIDSRVVKETGPGGDWSDTVEAEWARADGVPYPKSLVRVTEHPFGEGLTRTEWRLTVHEYDPHDRPPTEDLTVAGLDLPADTAVMKYDANGRLVSRSNSGTGLLPEERAARMIRELGTFNAAGRFAGGNDDGAGGEGSDDD